MLLRLLLWSTLLAAASSCSLFRAPPGEGEGEGGPPAIVAIDGDGSALAVSATVRTGDTAAAHRVSNGLVVSGSGFADITAIQLIDNRDDDNIVVFEPPFLVESTVRLTVDLAALPRAGLFTLAVVGAAGTANAEVFVLQGEPGRAGLSDVVDADEVACPFGGRIFRSGADDNGDGDLAVEEVTSSTVRCEEVVSGQHTVSVNSEEALTAALLELGQRRIASSALVTISVAVDELRLSAPIVIGHLDGRRVHLTSARDLTVLTFAATKTGLEVSHGGLTVSKLALRSEADEGIGLVVDSGAVVTVAGDLTIDGWSAGIRVTTGATLVASAPGVVAVDVSGIGAEATRSGSLLVDNLQVSSADFGVLVAVGGVFAGSGYTFAGQGSIGVLAIDRGVVNVDNATISSSGRHVFVSTGSQARIDRLVSRGAGTVAVTANDGGTISGVDVNIVTLQPNGVAASRGGLVTLTSTLGASLPAIAALASSNSVVRLPSGEFGCVAVTGGFCEPP